MTLLAVSSAVFLGMEAALLLRLLLARQPLPRWPAFLLPLLLLGLTIGHAMVAGNISAFLILFFLPAYLAAVLLFLTALPRLFRRRPPSVRWRGLRRATAAAGLFLVAFSALRAVQFETRRSSMPRLQAVRDEAGRESDYSAMSRTEAFSALCTKLEAEYPFTEWKGLDWDALCAETAPHIARAEAAGDDKAYYRALRDLAWCIPDGHVGLEGEDHGLRHEEVGGGLGFQVTELDGGRLVASRIVPGGSAERAGLRFAAEILAWNGQPVHQALAAVPVLWSEEPPATAEGRRLAQLRFLTRAPLGAQARVTFRNRGESSPRTAVLTAVEEEEELRNFNPFRELIFGGAVESRLLAEGAGYIRIKFELPSLFSIAPERAVARALERFVGENVTGVILDVRGNLGGQDVLVPRLVGFFHDGAGIYEIPGVFDRATGRFQAVESDAVPLTPASPRWRGKVAVLIDQWTISSGEGIPLVLQGRPGVAVIGWHGTQGSFAINQKSVAMPGGVTLVFPQARSLDGQGRIQVDSDHTGRGGVRPDRRLPLDEAALDALRQGRDPLLEEAIRFLRS